MRQKKGIRSFANIILISIFSMILLSVMSTAVGEIRMVCLGNNEQLDLGYTTYTCHSYLCMLCLKMGQSGEYVVNLNDCNELGLTCQGGGDNPDLNPPDITFINPTDNQILDSWTVNLQLEFNEEVKILKRSLDGEGARIMPCGGCTSASATLSNVRDGIHTLTIFARL